ncbi:MAG: TetR/AcrR family transcriptional regulator [Dehalococcoidia bacterium]|jgi:AcrR family transcriptional regulator
MRKIRTFSNDTELVNERRNHIVKKATELIARKGYNNINTRVLAMSLGMSTGGLYHYIGSKEDILYLIINFTSDLTTQALARSVTSSDGQGASSRLRASLKIYLETVENYRDFHNFVNHVMLSLSVRDRKIVYEAESRVVDYYESLLRSGIESGEFRKHDPKLIAHNIVAIANAWANRGWYLKKYYTLDKYTNEQTDALLAQITSQEKKPSGNSG